MRAEAIARETGALLERLSFEARRRSEAEYLANEDRYLFGGLSWEWLRSHPVPGGETTARIALLGDRERGLDRYCRALERHFSVRRPLAARVSALLQAAAILRCVLPEDFWLPIEADALLVVLSPTYREMRVRAYNRAAHVVPFREGGGPLRPRWQPYLSSVSISSEEHIPGRPDVLAAFWGMHELSHVVLITAPPEDEAALPRTYMRWMLGQEGKTIATTVRISQEVRYRVPHPAVVGLFNRPSISDGFDPVRSVAAPSKALLQAWLDLSRHASPPRIPGKRTLRALKTNDAFAVGSLVYALNNRAVYTAGARAALLRRLLPRPLPDSDPASGLLREVEDLVSGTSRLDFRARALSARENRIALQRFRLAELRDFLSVLPGAAPNAAAGVDRALLHMPDRPTDADLRRVGGVVRRTVKRELPVLTPFGFDESYADTHPSLFDIPA